MGIFIFMAVVNSPADSEVPNMINHLGVQFSETNCYKCISFYGGVSGI